MLYRFASDVIKNIYSTVCAMYLMRKVSFSYTFLSLILKNTNVS